MPLLVVLVKIRNIEQSSYLFQIRHRYRNKIFNRFSSPAQPQIQMVGCEDINDNVGGVISSSIDIAPEDKGGGQVHN